MSSAEWVTLVLVLPILGINFTVWGLVGLLRALVEVVGRFVRRLGEESPPIRRLTAPLPDARIRLNEVAVLMAAHNEELVIGDSMAALTRLINPAQIHVVSDFSTDRTVEIARAAGVQVIETPTNVGKANALAYALAELELLTRYRAVTILDADTRLDVDYFVHALPLLDDQRIAAVAGCAHTRWGGRMGFWGRVIVAHRARVYLLTQMLLKFGQTWGALSLTHIIPGFASTYRTTALAELEINAPGLVIEDFNMTFELNRKRLGRVVFDPRVRACTQDPATVGDYRKQVARWSLGLWQTVRKEMPGRPGFSLTLTGMLAETVVSSIYLLVLPVLLVVLAAATIWPDMTEYPIVGVVASHLHVVPVLLVVLGADYLLSVIAALVQRRPMYLAAGFFFLPLRMLDAYLGLASIPKAWRTKSTGQWTSPQRRAVSTS